MVKLEYLEEERKKIWKLLGLLGDRPRLNEQSVFPLVLRSRDEEVATCLFNQIANELGLHSTRGTAFHGIVITIICFGNGVYPVSGLWLGAKTLGKKKDPAEGEIFFLLSNQVLLFNNILRCWSFWAIDNVKGNSCTFVE